MLSKADRIPDLLARYEDANLVKSVPEDEVLKREIRGEMKRARKTF